ncbi:MAG: radical SAM family heme chaperone HemW [Spirochaetales bacterium]|nr:radical SAM family heme chaperone HemW [Spirochaetales bacterium]
MYSASNGLYFHVPYCRSKCHYCGFFSEAQALSPSLSVWDAWLKEILSCLAEETQKLDWGLFSTLYIGGGTPSLIPPEVLSSLLQHVQDYLDAEAEITFEANPDSLTALTLEILQQFRVTRISLGIQSFAAHVRQKVGRAVTDSQIQTARELLSTWPGDLSLDLIQGLPDQSLEDCLSDLSTAMSWNVEHLSLYPLSVEKGTVLYSQLHRGNLKLPQENDAWEKGIEILRHNDWDWYEIANFARNKAFCQHNLAYWKQKPYLGIGPGATTTFPRQEKGHKRRVWGQQALGFSLNFDEEYLTPLEWRKETLMLGLRTSEGISRQDWKAVSARNWETVLSRSLERFASWFVGSCEGDQLILQPDFRLYQDSFLREAFLDLDVDARAEV